MQMKETDKDPILFSVVCRVYQIPNYPLSPFTVLKLHFIKPIFRRLFQCFACITACLMYKQIYNIALSIFTGLLWHNIMLSLNASGELALLSYGTE